jgi:hypothetical protein
MFCSSRQLDKAWEHLTVFGVLKAVQNILSMRISHLITLSLFILIATLSPMSLLAASSVPEEEASKHLPNTLGNFKAASPAVPLDEQSADKFGSFGVTSAAIRSYQSKTGQTVSVALIVTRSDSSAYALLTNSGCSGGLREENATLRAELGTKSCVFPARIEFARGPVYVDVEFKKGDQVMSDTLQSFASVLAPTLDKGEDEVPVLVKHLPDWPNVPARVLYAVNPDTLKNLFSNRSVLDAVNFTGGAEAVVADYDTQKLVIIEFNTASLATDNDQRINAKLQELRNQGQPLPTAYRRVGNYSVFVFNAPTEQAANQLIDQVKYQQVVQWLGDNPYLYEQAEREFAETTLGVFVSVVKASGLALLTCFAVGGFLGALLFGRRRAQQRALEAYSDAGGMLRLNLDDITPQTDPSRLIGRGN